MSRSRNPLILAITLAAIALAVVIAAKNQNQTPPPVSLAKLVPSIEKKCLVASFMEELDLDYQLSRDGELFVSPRDLRQLRFELRNQGLNYLVDRNPTWRLYPSDLEYIVTLEEQRLGRKLSTILRTITQRRMIVWVKLHAGKVEFEEAHFSDSDNLDSEFCAGKVFIPRHVRTFKVSKLQVFVAIDEEFGEDRERIEAACRRAVGISRSQDSFKFVAGSWSKKLHALYWKSQE